MSKEGKAELRKFKLTRREVLRQMLVVGAVSAAGRDGLSVSQESHKRSIDDHSRLLPIVLPDGEWVEFSSDGFSAPVIGVIHRREYPALCGVPLGGYGTGCLDLETSGLFGLCSIFNSHTPRRGAMNWPFLGLSVGGKTWVLTTGQQSAEKGDHYAANEPRAAGPSLTWREPGQRHSLLGPLSSSGSGV